MSTQTPLQFGLEALKAGRVDEAIEHLEKAIADNPNDYQGYSCIGVAYAQKKLYNRAVGVFLMAIRLRPGVASVHYNLGLAYQADGQNEQAGEEFQKALLIDPAYQKASDALKVLNQRDQDFSSRTCARHAEEPSVGFCHFCHLAVCAKCNVIVQGETYCSKCAENVARD